MKKLKNYILILMAAPLLLLSCKKFQDINTNPVAASTDQVQVEYFIDNSIIKAQQNPDVSERGFVLYWVAAGRQMGDADGATFSWGGYDDGWTSNVYANQSSALNFINSAISVANQQILAGTSKAYTNNLLQVSRIWRAYLLSEMSDCYGPMPIDGFQGVNPNFVDVKSVYYYMLDELKDANTKLDPSVTVTDNAVTKEDPAYAFNFTNWKAYCNSLRLRLAMRLSQVDAAKAKTEFEAAASQSLLTNNNQIFQIQEKPGWDDLSGAYTRCWYQLPISTTLDNLMKGLGSVKSSDQIAGVIASPSEQALAQANVKPANYVGQYFPAQLTTKTNNPYSAFWMDGLPYTIDPRAFQIFYMPGNSSDPSFPSGTCGAVNNVTVGPIKDAAMHTIRNIDAKYTWNGVPDGNWGVKGGYGDHMFKAIDITTTMGMVPTLSQKFRGQTAKRVFFAPWETYFLLAEGAVRGWATPVSGQTAYESGISSSFAYWGISSFLPTYLTSTDYNRNGTSVSWTNTTEPGASRTMTYVDGLNLVDTSTMVVNYPVNNLYQNGTVRNDLLTKIITQKFIAQTPWLPLETWSDHRRLGLPFFDNVVLEDVIPTLPDLTASTYMTSSVKFFPQRMKYPSGLQNSNINGYNQAKAALNGDDLVLTPLWWAQH
ncbi:MAG: SusD/RagB family nutrient-binding outer membrane lipoprotein [Bacteroidetes bacterium]|nr:SusD/RagB family nutrient-binding outer membrane lipoprotein [Bacteroidota bacterium]MBS1757996.1 SusD/RagB family nutrient-binding outer membrane lipoprotein [Bacteroidota bacterium]